MSPTRTATWRRSAESANELERRGHNPLLFFLKRLEADDARLPELIRAEIKARTFFVLCNTRASRRSKWVKQETENHGLRGLHG